MNTPPRAWTAEEVREQFLKRLLSIAKYWATVHNGGDIENRCDGVVHSILAVIDGRTLPHPQFKLIPYPHEEDKNYNIENGENWYEATDISDGALTEQLFRHKKT